MTEKKLLPQVDLFTDGLEASNTAESLLRQNRITYRKLVAGKDYNPAPGFVPPVLNAREGQYKGLSGIQDYVTVNTVGK